MTASSNRRARCLLRSIGTPVAPAWRPRRFEMTTHAMHHDQTSLALPRWLIVGFISGAVSVLLFHQGAAALLHALGLTPRAPYSMQSTAPFGIPQLWSLA